MPEVVARKLYEPESRATSWDDLPGRRRKRLCNRVKRWLNTRVAEHMTPELLADRDVDGEVVAWLKTIGRLADGGE